MPTGTGEGASYARRCVRSQEPYGLRGAHPASTGENALDAAVVFTRVRQTLKRLSLPLEELGVYKSRLRSLRIARLVSVTAGFSSYLLASIRGLIRGSTPILRIGVACLACPLGLLQLAAALFSISSVALVGVLTALTLALFLGRVLCGWIYPTGLVATEIVRVRRSKEWVLAIVIAASTPSRH